MKDDNNIKSIRINAEKAEEPLTTPAQRIQTFLSDGNAKVQNHLEARRAHKASPEYQAEQEQQQTWCQMK